MKKFVLYIMNSTILLFQLPFSRFLSQLPCLWRMDSMVVLGAQGILGSDFQSLEWRGEYWLYYSETKIQEHQVSLQLTWLSLSCVCYCYVPRVQARGPCIGLALCTSHGRELDLRRTWWWLWSWCVWYHPSKAHACVERTTFYCFCKKKWH